MMKQLAPAFDLARYKTTLKDLAHQAQEEGFVSVAENPGSDFTLTAPLSPKAPIIPARESARREYDFSTQATTNRKLQDHTTGAPYPAAALADSKGVHSTGLG